MNAIKYLIAMALASILLVAASETLRPNLTLAQEILTGVSSVIDGDTIDIHGQRIRLFGMDAVESGQRCTRDGKPWLCGKDSAFALADFTGTGRSLRARSCPV